MLSPKLQPRTGVGFALTPTMRLGMDLLRLPPNELTERLLAEAEANPLLIVEDRPRTSDMGEGRGGTVDVADLAIAAPESLGEHLRRQLSTMPLAADVRNLAEYLTETLDERGFLTQSRAEIAVETRFRLPIVEAAIAALTECEPAGVGARNLQNCLALQLQRDGMDPERAQDVVGCFEALMTGEWARAQAVLGGSLADMQALATELYGLDVDPARAFNHTPTIHLVPDLLVERHDDDSLSVATLDTWMPRISIDRILRVQGREDERSRDFVEKRVRDAEALLTAVAFRRKTLLLLGEFIAAAQSAFFLGNASLPVPYTRVEAAHALGVHPATVGRALQGRALQFDGRVFPMSWFFPRALASHEGTSLSTVAVQGRLRELVSSEPPGAPYSDAELCQKLQDAGVDIARRTVAKYRDAMNIPSSHIRRRLATRPDRRVT